MSKEKAKAVLFKRLAEVQHLGLKAIALHPWQVRLIGDLAVRRENGLYFQNLRIEEIHDKPEPAEISPQNR